MSVSNEERARETWDDDGGGLAKGVAKTAAPVEYFTAKKFQIPELKGISARNIKEHLELYAGYVKFSNHIVKQIKELPKDSETASYELSLLQRRFAYEHNGMKNHEIFFEQLEGGSANYTQGGPFLKQVSRDFGTFDALLGCLKGIAMTRGVGWTMLYFCRETGHLLPQWVDEHHIGLLSGPQLILALDMWEHAFVYDYATSEKKKYVDVFFENLNWKKVETRFKP